MKIKKEEIIFGTSDAIRNHLSEKYGFTPDIKSEEGFQIIMNPQPNKDIYLFIRSDNAHLNARFIQTKELLIGQMNNLMEYIQETYNPQYEDEYITDKLGYFEKGATLKQQLKQQLERYHFSDEPQFYMLFLTKKSSELTKIETIQLLVTETQLFPT